MMQIKVYDVDQDTGAETFAHLCDLSDAFETGSEEYIEAEEELLASGRYWSGGGASPLSLLIRTRRSSDYG